MLRTCILFLSLFLLFSKNSEAAIKSLSTKLPTVVVSIKPIHSLVASVTAGILNPVLLVDGNSSPHTHALTPSQLQTLLRADLFIWVGECYETHMYQTVHKTITKQKLVTISDFEGLTLYPYRSESIWEGEFKEACDQNEANEHHAHDCEHHGHSHHPTSIDGHLWLDPDNAIVIVRELASIFSEIDPKNAEHYRNNAKQTIERLKELDHTLKQALRFVSKKPYIIYHDAIQYFDKHFGTKAVAAITTEPGIPPKAQHLIKLERLLENKGTSMHPSCIFEEPQFSNSISQRLADKHNLRHHMIDYLGQGIVPGPDAYFVIMKQLAEEMIKGLS